MMERKDVIPDPNTAAFSRLKYLPRLGTEQQQAEFIRGLITTAVESRYDGDYGVLDRFLDEWGETSIGLQFKNMVIPASDSIPWAVLEKPLSEAKIALVTTGGVFVDGEAPYSERDDHTYRIIKRDTPTDKLRIWHPGYDNKPAIQDINCIFPIDRFKELESEGLIGALSDSNFSFMGLINTTENLINDSAPEVAGIMKDQGVDAAFLAST